MMTNYAVEGIDHVEVFVREIDAAIRCYADVLGLTVVYRWNPQPVLIGADGTMPALFQAERSRSVGTNALP
jgi:catechol 2,3-dioxygenase-like lactoylglutathione lyase family enzyme